MSHALPQQPSAETDEAARKRAESYLGRVLSKRYRIDEVIAMGGMGAVYRGEHVHLRRRVAIKILHPDTERLPELVKRFEREAIAGAHIQHPNVATATDFGEADDGSYFLVVELVRGATLHEIIKRGPLPVARAAHIARQLAAALDAVHAMGMVHRDVKPRNIMVAEAQGDLVKLIDFGLAKVAVDRLSAVASEAERVSVPDRLTGTGVVFGTLAYLAPEAAFGMDAVDERSDLYALGLIFYEMLAGKHPFQARDPFEQFNQQRSVRPPPIASLVPGVEVPPALEAVVLRLLEKQPLGRYATGGEVVAAIDEACAAAGMAIPGSTSLAPATSPSTRPPPATTPEPPPKPATETVTAATTETVTAASTETVTAASTETVTAAATKTAAKTVAGPAPASGARAESRAAAAPRSPAKTRSEAEPRSAPAPEAKSEPRPAAAPPVRRGLGTYLALAVIAAAAIFFYLATRAGEPPPPAPPPPHAAAPPTAAPVETAAPAPTPAPTETAPAASASAAPEASASAPPPEAAPDLATREALVAAVKADRWAEAAEALDALARRDPGALGDRKVAAAASKLALSISLGGGKHADMVFGALSGGLAPAGLDVLYDIIEARGRSAPALRAAELLRDPEVAARATPATRIAFQLRDVPCDKKLTLLDRGVADGDGRALLVMEKVVRACFKHSRTVDDAIRKLRARLKAK